MAFSTFKAPRLPRVPNFSSPSNPYKVYSPSLPAPDQTVQDILAGNDKTRTKLTEMGITPPEKAESQPGFLEQIFSPLRMGSTGVQSIIHNLVNSATDRDVNPLEEMGKALTGKKSLEFSDITKDLGWNPTDGVGRVAKALVDFAGEVATDPLTWVSFGTSSLVKEGALATAKTIATTGLTREAAALYGVADLFDGVADSVKVLDGIGDLKFADQTRLWAGILRNEMAVAKDAGGIKVFTKINPFGADKFKGVSLVSGETVDKLIPQGVKNAMTAAKGSKVASGAVGLFDVAKRTSWTSGPMAAAAYMGVLDEYGRALRTGEMAAADAFEAISGKIPESVKQYMGIAIERSIGNDARKRLGWLSRTIQKLDGQGAQPKYIDNRIASKTEKAGGIIGKAAKELKLAEAQKVRDAESVALNGVKVSVSQGSDPEAVGKFIGNLDQMPSEFGLSHKTPQDLAEATLHTASDGKAGAAIYPETYSGWYDGPANIEPGSLELGSVFRNEGAVKGSGTAAAVDAIQAGLKKTDHIYLDAFDEGNHALIDMYKRYGFEEVDRLPYDASMAPDAIVAKYPKGNGPDVVLMKLNKDKFAEFLKENPKLISGRARIEVAGDVADTGFKIADDAAKAAEDAATTAKAVLKAAGKNATPVQKARYAGLAKKAAELRAKADSFYDNFAELTAFQEDAANLRREFSKLLTEDVNWDKVAAHLSSISGASDEEVRAGIEALQEYGFTERNAAQRMAENAADIKTGDRGLGYVARFDGDTPAEVVEGAQRTGTATLPDGSTVELGPQNKKFAKLDPTEDVLAKERGEIPNRGDYIPGASLPNAQKRTNDTMEAAMASGQGVETDFEKVLVERQRLSGRKIAEANLRTNLGRTFGKKIPKGGAPKGYVEWAMPSGEKVMIPKQIHADVEQIFRPLISDESVGAFRKGWETVNNAWRRWATTSSTGFVIRNMQSNFYLAWAKGYSDPKSWDLAIRIAQGILKDTDMVKVGGVEKSVLEWKRIMRIHDVMDSGEISQAMREAADLAKVTPTGEKVAYYASGGALTKGIGKFNQHVEHTGRMAVFFNAMEKTGGKEIVSASIVNRVLYNYDASKLSPAMKNVREVVPFIVWIRNNLPSMVDVLLHDPAKVSIVDKMQKASEDMLGGKDVVNGATPQYIRDMIPIAINLPGMTQPLMLNPNWGFQDLNKISIFVDAAKGDFGSAAKEALGMITPFLKVPIELGMNQDAFYGTPIEKYPGQLVPARGGVQAIDDAFSRLPWWNDMLKYFGVKHNPKTGALMVTPKFIKFIDTNPFFSNLDKAMTEGPQQKSRWISWLAGIKLMPIETEKWAKQQALSDRQVLRDAIQKMKDEGRLP